MPQPVQPPETPAIIQSVTSQETVNFDESSNGTAASIPHRALSTGVVATPTPPETFAPESSALTTPQSAKLLGPPISVGYSLQPAPTETQELPGTQLNVGSSNPQPANRQAADLELANPQSINWQPANQQPANLQLSNPQPTNQQPANLQLANQQPANLQLANQQPANLQLANQQPTNQQPAKLQLANPQPANLQPANLQLANQQPTNLQPSSLASGSDELEENSLTDRSDASNVISSTLSFITQPSYEVRSNVKRLITQERGGESREFELTIPTPETQPSPDEETPPATQEPEAAPQSPPSPESPSAVPTTPFGSGGVLELTADQQEYDDQRRVITAEGNVLLRFREAVIDADRVQVNLPNRIVVAEGNVALTRGDQVLRGNRFEYYFVQDSGVIANASGEIFQPTAGTDLSLSPTNIGADTVQARPLSDRITRNQPLERITNPGGYSFVVGGRRTVQNQPNQSGQVALSQLESGGQVNRLRFEAERVDFDSTGWQASNVRMTNDPFSPPELEIRADTATLTRISPLRDEVVASRPRLVFDQGFSVPLLRNRFVIDRRERDPGLVNFGFDEEDRGGVFVERTFEPINTEQVRLRITPQFLVQKSLFGENDSDDDDDAIDGDDGDDEGGIFNPSSYGLKARLDATLSPRTSLTGRATFTSLDLSEAEDKLRASLRLRQTIGTTLPHTLNLEYSYRDRLFNGSLGFQTVQSSLGAVLTSPTFALGNSGLYLNYQVGAQYINSETDRVDLLEPIRTNNRVNLGRFQASASLSRSFLLWQGEALPATPTEGLRYTPAPVVPYLSLTTSATGVTSAYTSGDTQNSLNGYVGLTGQFGHFSRPFFDYTGFNIGYSQYIQKGLSPFLFDRAVDNKILTGGIVQQIYGPFRLGFQTTLSLDTGEQISTDYILEYSRRAYNITLRYNPVLSIGSLSFRINDFNWVGGTEPFAGADIRPVVQGVTQ